MTLGLVLAGWALVCGGFAVGYAIGALVGYHRGDADGYGRGQTDALTELVGVERGSLQYLAVRQVVEEAQRN